VTFTGTAPPSPVPLDSGLTLSTDNIDPISSATVAITGGFLAGDTLSFGAVAGATVGASTTSGGVVSETLSFADGDTIGAAYNTATGLLTLTTVTRASTTTATDYQAALRGIEFSNAGDPTNGGSDKTRTLTWTVVDENQNANSPTGPAGNGNTATGTSGVTAASSGPSLAAGALVTFTENQAPMLLDTGLSLLNAVGLPELVTKSLEEYEALALKLAREPELLSTYRDRLEKNGPTAPLFDADRFRRHLEQAYTTMLDIERRGEKPRGFSVDPT
jgi:hypothetical protein